MRAVRLWFIAILAASAAPAAAAQSLLYRPPNLGGTWVPAGGVLQFNFLHRFSVSDASTNNVVSNYPTFTFALGLGRRIALGTRFATRSLVPSNGTNEFELYGRLSMGAAEGTNGLALAITPAYNTAAESVDGELAVDYTKGAFTLSAAGRAMSDALGAGEARFAAAGGLSFRINDYIALDGDIAQMFGVDGADPAWSAGLSVVIPGSPHTFSLHASTSTSTTIQGASVNVGDIIYGFEFTIPIHFSRFAPWFAKKSKGDSAIAVTVPFMNAAAQVEMRDLSFRTDSVVITAGQSVGWVNRDEVGHTVTFDSGGMRSSGDIPARGTFVATFPRAGVYRYHCAPHPNMTGVVVVQ